MTKGKGKGKAKAAVDEHPEDSLRKISTLFPITLVRAITSGSPGWGDRVSQLRVVSDVSTAQDFAEYVAFIFCLTRASACFASQERCALLDNILAERPGYRLGELTESVVKNKIKV